RPTAFCSGARHPRLLHSFPTRRSSDLVEAETEQIDAELVRMFELPASQGALVVRVVPGSPADRGGLRPFDLITAVGGRPVNSARSEEHTSELQSRENLVCRLLLEKKNM